jgi:hypothetical protein
MFLDNVAEPEPQRIATLCGQEPELMSNATSALILCLVIVFLMKKFE